MSKSDVARRGLAETFLASDIDDRVETTPALAKRIGVSLGTVHAAITLLEQEGLVSTTSHGAKGRRLVDRDFIRLWAASGRGALTGVLPLPESREMAGLATAIMSTSDVRHIPVQLFFHQGGHVRLDALESGRVDFVVTSGSLARAHHSSTDRLELHPHSYYGAGSLVVITSRDSAVQPPRSVAADPASADHYAMTLQEFPRVPVVEKPYMFIPAAVADQEVDAAIWHRTGPSPLMVATGLAVHPLQQPALSDLEEFNRAALVWRKNDSIIGHVLHHLFDPDHIEIVQREVLEGRRVPRF